MYMEGREVTLDHHSTNPTGDRKDSAKSLPSEAIKKLSSVDGLSSGSSLQQETFATARNFSPQLSRKMVGTTNASRKAPVIPIDLDGALDTNASCSKLDSSLTKGLPGPPFICKHTVDDISAQVSWMAPFSRQPVSFYQLVVQEVDVNSTDTATEKLNPWLLQIASTSVELRNLTPNVEYLVRVRAVTTAGAGEWCKPYKFATLVPAGEGFSDPGHVTVTVCRKKDAHRKVICLDRCGREGLHGRSKSLRVWPSQT
ncbi:fibronectin type III domain-containing protein 8 [Pelodiscus sinensis]